MNPPTTEGSPGPGPTTMASIVGPDGNFGVKIRDFVRCPETRCGKQMKREEVIQHMTLYHKMYLADFNGKAQPLTTRVCLLSPPRLLNLETAKTWSWVARVIKWEEYTFFLHVKVENMDTILMWMSLFVEHPEEVTPRAQQLVCSLQLKSATDEDSVNEAEAQLWNGIILPTNFLNEPVPQFKLSRKDIEKVKFQKSRREPDTGFNEYFIVQFTLGRFRKIREMCTMRYVSSLMPEASAPEVKPEVKMAAETSSVALDKDEEVLGRKVQVSPKKLYLSDDEEDEEEPDVPIVLRERSPIKFVPGEFDSESSDEELPMNPYPLQMPPVLEPAQVEYSDSDPEDDHTFPIVLPERPVLTYFQTLNLKRY